MSALYNTFSQIATPCGYNVAENIIIIVPGGDLRMFKLNKIYKSSRTDIGINIRFPEEIYNKYKTLAKDTGHSFNGLVINAMAYALENME